MLTLLLLQACAAISVNPLMGTLKPQSNGNTSTGRLAVDGLAGLLHLVQRGGAWAGRGADQTPRSSNITAHPLTASVPTSHYSSQGKSLFNQHVRRTLLHNER